jgi:hypothetical protein
MKRALKILLYAVAALVVVVLAGALLLPDRGTVGRTRTMKASPAQIRPLLDDFKNGWSRWSPFEDEGPFTYSGPDAGAGARRDFGAGFMAITRDDPSEVDYHLEIRPIAFEIDGSFVLASSGEGALVTWTDRWHYRRAPFRWFGLMMDHAMGPTMDSGLEKLDREAMAR